MTHKQANGFLMVACICLFCLVVLEALMVREYMGLWESSREINKSLLRQLDEQSRKSDHWFDEYMKVRFPVHEI